MKKLFALASVLILFTACSGSVNWTRKDFENNRWPQSEVVYFDVKSPGVLKPATLYISYSHVFEPQFTEIPVEVDITAPNGTKETVPVVIHLKDKAGNSLSDCVGDVCDLDVVLKQIESPQEGEYKIGIRNKFPSAYLPNTIAIGIKFTNVD